MVFGGRVNTILWDSVFDNFISNIKNGFKVANAVRKLVFSDKGLFMYPILAIIIDLVVAALVVGVGVAIFLTGALSGLSTGEYILIAIAVLFVLYFILFFVISYFTMAMLIAFREHMKGKHMGMGDALGSTSAYTTLIIKWALFYTVIITIIDIIEALVRAALSRFGIAGRVISGLITGGMDLALAAAVAFSLPVILDERKGPIDALRASISFIAKNFGDTFGGLIYTEIFQIVFLLMGLGCIFLGFIAITNSGSVASASVGTLLGVLGIAMLIIGFVLILVGILLRYVLFNCFKLIIYDYKTRHTLPKGFDAKLIDNSIKRKNKPGSGKINLNPFGVGAGQGDI